MKKILGLLIALALMLFAIPAVEGQSEASGHLGSLVDEQLGGEEEATTASEACNDPVLPVGISGIVVYTQISESAAYVGRCADHFTSIVTDCLQNVPTCPLETVGVVYQCAMNPSVETCRAAIET